MGAMPCTRLTSGNYFVDDEAPLELVGDRYDLNFSDHASIFVLRHFALEMHPTDQRKLFEKAILLMMRHLRRPECCAVINNLSSELTVMPLFYF